MSKLLTERIKQLQEQQAKIEALEAYSAELAKVNLGEQYSEIHKRMLALVQAQIQADIQAIERQADISAETTSKPEKPAIPQVTTVDQAFHRKWEHLLNQPVLAPASDGSKVEGKVVAIAYPKVKVSFENHGIFLLPPDQLELKGAKNVK